MTGKANKVQIGNPEGLIEWDLSFTYFHLDIIDSNRYMISGSSANRCNATLKNSAAAYSKLFGNKF